MMFANEIAALIAIVAFLVLFYGPWQWVCTDYARQILFEKRDYIFDLAASGELSFKSDEYRTIRSTIESGIRFAHDLTFSRIIFLVVFHRWHENEKPDMFKEIENIKDEDTQKKIRNAVREATLALLIMVACKSIFTIIITPILLVFVSGVFLFDACREYFNKILISLGGFIYGEAESPMYARVFAKR